MDVDPNVNPDVDPNALEGLDILENVTEDVPQDAVAEVNYLVDNIGDIVADDNNNVSTGEDVLLATMDGVPTAPVEHATKDVEQSTRELNDMYSISVKEVGREEQVSPLPPTQMSTPQKVLYIRGSILCKALTLQPMSSLMFSCSHLCCIQHI